MNRAQLFELLQIDPKRVPDEEEFWAVYATSFYERIFLKFDTPREVENAYDMMAKRLRGKVKKAAEFFAAVRIGELEDPTFWDQSQHRKITENMKAKSVKESLNESHIIKDNLDQLNEYSIWDRAKDELSDVLNVKQTKPFKDSYNLAFNKPLFDWLNDLHNKYNEENASEYISELFIRVYDEDEDKLKEMAYLKLKNYIGFKIPFILELFTRFDELRRNASRL